MNENESSNSAIQPFTQDNFLSQIVQLSTENKDNPEAVYPLLQANLDKLYNLKTQQGASLTQILRRWAIVALPELEIDRAENFAEGILNFSSLIKQFPQGDRAKNLEIAITGYEIVNDVFNRQESPQRWAKIQNHLGNAYFHRIRGDKPKNLEKAINYYQKSLQFYTCEAFPEIWAEIQNNLGNTYRDRILGDSAENVKLAMNCYQAALEVRNRQAFPQQWAETQKNLGNSYRDRVQGDRTDNLEQAIHCYKSALEVYIREAFPQQWASIQNNLGSAYYSRIRHERSDNLERAIFSYQAALEVLTREIFPQEWGTIQNNLGNVYRDRMQGDEWENIELAIGLYKASLEVRTRESLPLGWATTQNNLGNAYRDRIKGERAENLKLAIECHQSALQIFSRESYPQDWATTQINLGNAYRDSGKIDLAIEYFWSAIEIHTPSANPIEALKAGINLGNTAFAVGDWSQAIEGYSVAVQGVEKSRAWAVTDKRRQEVLSSAIEVYGDIVQAYIYANQPDKAIEYVERSKARNLVDLIATRDLHPKGNIPKNIQNQLRQLRQDIDYEQRRIDIKESNQIADSSSASLSDTERLHELKEQLDQLITEQIQPIDPTFNRLQRVKKIKFSEIQALLPNNHTVIIEWYITNDKFFAFIVTPQISTPIVWQSSSEDLKALFEWADVYIEDYKKQKFLWRRDLAYRCQNLNQILHLDTILSYISPNINELILIPHRFMHLFPLHALETKRLVQGEGGDDYEFTACLLDLFPGGVRYAPSCQLLQLTQNQQHPDFKTLFAIQNPTNDLYYTDLEVQTIQLFFDSSKLLVKEKANTANLMQGGQPQNSLLRTANCVHFSCHAHFNFKQPLLSALLLADCYIPAVVRPEPNRNLLEQNGVDLKKCLTLADIFTLDLSQCCLVTLSACETGLTDYKSLSDEYMGLSSGFLVAGSPSIINTLWAVTDLHTALLMIRFYQNLHSRLTVAVALNQAQIWLRDITTKNLRAWASDLNLNESFNQAMDEILDWYDGEEYPFQNLLYWAAFCAVGQSPLCFDFEKSQYNTSHTVGQPVTKNSKSTILNQMTSDPLLQALPALLETKPELFSPNDLQDFLQTLAPLENNPPKNADEILREWCKARKPIRNALRNLASDRAEIKNVKPSESNDSKRTTNFFQELSQQVKDKLEQQSESQNKQ
ncbi:MAG: CHAT domain-containing protein [Cyanobacteria bacterium J06633_8]